jgi:hypothetical protein
MIFHKALIVLAAAGLTLGSTAVAAAPVGADEIRIGSPVDETEGLRGWGWLLLLIAAAAALVVVLGSNDSPESP